MSFTGVPEGAVLTVSHEVGGVQTPTANENGTIAYLLIPGTYSDTVKRDDYRTVHDTVTVEAAAQSVPVSMVVITPWDGTVATGFAGGNGTQDAPYEIESGDELMYNGALIGDEYGRLNPCNYATRAEIAVILMRLANLNN